MYNYLFLKLLFLVFIGLGVLFLYYSGIGCVWRHFLGITCPGCGMTRAYLSLLGGDIIGAFRHHFMFWSVPLIFVYVIFEHKLLSKTLHKIILGIIAVGFLVNWII